MTNVPKQMEFLSVCEMSF